MYEILWEPKALKAFKKLDATVRGQFVDKLQEIAVNPHIPGNALHGKLAGCYKIKLRASGFRLVYEVNDGQILIYVLAVGKRERKEAYNLATKARKS